MALPKQVEKQLKDLEEIEQQMQAPAGAADTGGQTAEATDPQVEESTSAEAEPTEPVAQEVPEEKWEQKYRRLQGKYDTEVPRLHQQVNQLTAKIQELTQQLAAKNEQPPKDTQPRLVTDADEETFGKDLIDLQRRVAKEVAAEYTAVIEAQRAKIAELEDRLAKTGDAVGELSFEARLARAIPDFDVINADPRWIAWLDEYVPDLRGPRRPLLQAIFDRGDVAALADYVALWKKSIATAESGSRKSEVERQIAPVRSASVRETTPAARIYTAAEAEKLFAKVRNLNIAGKYDEANKLEAELSAAYVEGRVR